MKPIALQAHCVREYLARDFPGTLKRIADTGIRQLELCSFPGCRGNPWGDFGDLAELPPEIIAATLANFGMTSVSCHVNLGELSPERFADTVHWVKKTGSPVVVLASLPPLKEAGQEVWTDHIQLLNDLGTRLADHGLGFAYHTQLDAWASVGSSCFVDCILNSVDPKLCHLELDPSGALVYQADWLSVIHRYPKQLFALHLRDGITPKTPVPYLPALPLGSGDLAWADALKPGLVEAVHHLILEMETDPGSDVFDAIDTSMKFLQDLPN